MNHSKDLIARMAAAGLPVDDLAIRRAELPIPMQELHRRILTTIAATGRAPTPEHIQSWASELDLDAAGALHALAAAELIFVSNRPATGQGPLPKVTGGVPFAAGASAHCVQINDGPEVRANCAVDALGIAAMVGRDTTVRSTDPLTGQAVTAVSRSQTWTWQPASAVVFCGSNGSGRPLTQSCCPVINFFTSEANARAYQAQHRLEGDVLSMADAADAGALVFGHLLSKPTDG